MKQPTPLISGSSVLFPSKLDSGGQELAYPFPRRIPSHDPEAQAALLPREDVSAHQNRGIHGSGAGPRAG
jgi:hypothetical protein